MPINSDADTCSTSMFSALMCVPVKVHCICLHNRSLHNVLPTQLSIHQACLTGYCLAMTLQIQVQLQELLLQFCSAEVYTPPMKVLYCLH